MDDAGGGGSGESILARVDRIAELMIEHDMRWHGFNPTRGGYYDTTADEQTDPDNPVCPGWIPGPGGPPTADVVVPTAFRGEAGKDSFNPTQDVYEHWPKRIREMFDPFLEMPRDSSFDGLVEDLKTATESIALDSAREKGAFKFEHHSNDALASALTVGTVKLGELDGKAMHAFLLHYWGKLDPLIGRYYLATSMQWALAQAEAKIWRHAWRDLETICDKTIEGLKHPGIVDISFEAIAAIAGLLKFLPGPAGVASDAVAAVATATAPLHKAYTHKKAQRQYDFDGDAGEVEAEIKRILKDLSDDICNQEDGLSESARSLEGELHDRAFSLDRCDEILDADDPDDILTDRDRVQIEETSLHFIADDILKTIAHALRTTGTHAQVEGHREQFSRAVQVGRAQLGPYPAMVNVGQSLNLRLDTTADQLDDVGEVLIVLARVFTETDEQVRRELANLDN